MRAAKILLINIHEMRKLDLLTAAALPAARTLHSQSVDDFADDLGRFELLTALKKATDET